MSLSVNTSSTGPAIENTSGIDNNLYERIYINYNNY